MKKISLLIVGFLVIGCTQPKLTPEQRDKEVDNYVMLAKSAKSKGQYLIAAKYVRKASASVHEGDGSCFDRFKSGSVRQTQCTNYWGKRRMKIFNMEMEIMLAEMGEAERRGDLK